MKCKDCKGAGILRLHDAAAGDSLILSLPNHAMECPTCEGTGKQAA